MTLIPGDGQSCYWLVTLLIQPIYLVLGIGPEISEAVKAIYAAAQVRPFHVRR